MKNSKVTGRESKVTGREEASRDIEYANAVVDTVREPLIVLNTGLRVISANESFYKTFKVSKKETENHLIYRLGNNQWDIPKLRKLLEEILPKKKVFDNFEVEHEFLGIGKKTMLLNAREIDHLSIILLAIEDITEQKNAQKKLEIFHEVAVGRELKMIELKKRIKELENKLNGGKS